MTRGPAANPQDAVKHYANAVRVYGNPATLIQMLKRTLPPATFLMLMQELQRSAQGQGQAELE